MRFRLFIVLLFLSVASTAAEVQGQQNYQRSTSLVTVDGDRYYVHTVKRGETLYSLSRLYSVGESDIRRSNPHITDGLQEGHVLKIPAKLEQEKLSARKQARTFETHIVNKGETLYSISRRYEIPINTLLEDNPGLDPSTLAIGQVINIRKKSRGDATPEQIEEQINDYRDAINSLPTGFVYHIVERGETIFGLSKLFDVTEEDILGNNDLRDGLKAGDMIKIPTSGQNPIAGIGMPEDSLSIDLPVEGFDSTFRGGDYEGGIVRQFGQRNAPKVAVLLPLKDPDGSGNRNFIDFYNGFLLGLEDLKAEGVSADVTLYNTSRTSSVVYDITETPSFAGTDIIIGPVYEDNLLPALQFAQVNSIPVVSPLATMSKVGGGLLYQMSPERGTKYDKMKEMLAGKDYNIVFISSSYKDDEMEKEIRPLLPANTKYINLTGNITARQVTDALERSRDNLIFISCTNEVVADQIMATISSVQNNLVARSMSGGGIRVVATPRWARFGKTLDRNLYFKLNLCYTTNYHADRGNAVIREFDRRFLSAFGVVPSQYAYRGYDTAKLFIGSAAKGGDYNRNLNSGSELLLQMPYRFERTGLYGTMVNSEWALVCYRNNYTIEVR